MRTSSRHYWRPRGGRPGCDHRGARRSRRAAVEAASAVVADITAAMLQAAYDVDTPAPERTKAPRPAGAERGA